MSRFLTFVFLIALIAGGYVWVTPYVTVQNLTQAMEDEDAAQVDRYVDFESVRAGFQDDFTTRMGLDDSAESNTMEAMGNTLVTRIAGAFIDTIVSPDTMVSVLKDHDRRERLGLSSDLGTVIGRGSWINKNQFVLHDAFGKPTMLLQRHGIDWEVTAISLK